MCSKKPPKAPAGIDQSAQQSTALAQEQQSLAKEQLAWEKDRAARQDPLVEKIANQQIEASDVNAQRAASQWKAYQDLFAPIEAQVASDAANYDSPERQARMAAEAGADVARGYDASADTTARQMERMGINPNSGRFQGLVNETALARAKDTAGAMNAARRNTELQGIGLRQQAANFGRNLPNTGIAADTTGSNIGSSAIGNLNAGNAARQASQATAQNWYGGAQGGTNAAGNLLTGQYSNQLNAWNQNEQNKAASMAGFGQLAGMGLALMRKGGVIKGEGYIAPEDVAAGGKPTVPQTSGSISTEKTISFESDGKHHVIPTIVNGQSYDDDSAIKLWAHGKNPAIASFDSQDEATAFAEQRSRDLDRSFGGGGRLIKGPSSPASGGLRSYAAGGLVRGPGTGSSDSIPATIEGVQPARLSNGEAVLNAEAVDLVGEDFIHRLNAAALGGLSRGRRVVS